MTKDCFNCKFGDVALCNEPCRTCKFNPTDTPTHWQAPDCLACAALRAENERLKAEVERLQISEVEQIARNISEMRAIQVRAENERLRGFVGHIMTLGLLRGSPRLRDEALRILDGVELSDIDDSKQDFNNRD